MKFKEEAEKILELAKSANADQWLTTKPAVIIQLLERLLKLEDALKEARYRFVVITDAAKKDGDLCALEAQKAISELDRDTKEEGHGN